ncbi:MAG: DUF883 family protein [Bdellovibrionales bacterium]|nr:DUF883 family protein [Bdellovibrionales bacterium]
MGGKPRNFSQAIDELEDVVRSGAGSASELRGRLEQELHKIEETLKTLKPHIEDLGNKFGDEAKKAKDRVENQVGKNPWAALGIVGLVFFVLGFLFGFSGTRRRD